eukprot:1146846-Pelagomonas_calceolata.AAC.5
MQLVAEGGAVGAKGSHGRRCCRSQRVPSTRGLWTEGGGMTHWAPGRAPDPPAPTAPVANPPASAALAANPPASAPAPAPAAAVAAFAAPDAAAAADGLVPGLVAGADGPTAPWPALDSPCTVRRCLSLTGAMGAKAGVTSEYLQGAKASYRQDAVPRHHQRWLPMVH